MQDSIDGDVLVHSGILSRMFKIYGVFVVAYIFVVALAPAQFLSADNADISVTVAAIQCNDGLDNDSDGHTDYPDDPGCDSALDTDETDPPLCGDNICNGIESCSSCSLDCGVCTTTTANTSGGGGGGGIVIVPNTPTVQETQTDSGEAAGEQTRAVARMVASVSSSITTALNTLVTQLSQFVARMQQDTVRTAQVPEVPDEPVETSLIIDTE